MPNVQAFLFTADRDDRSGQYALRFYGRALDGNSTRPIEVVITNVPPVFFVERGLELPEYIRYRERRPVELRTLNGQDVDALYFNGEYDLRQAREQLRARGFKTYEGDVNSGDRYLMERFLNGAVTVSGECRSHNHTLIFENPKIQPGTARIKPITASIDIETGVADNRLYSIAVDIVNADQDSESPRLNRNPSGDSPGTSIETSIEISIGTSIETSIDRTGLHAGPTVRTGQVFMLGQGPALTPEDDFRITYCENEAELLRKFFAYLAAMDPDALIGWNVVSFDLAFLLRKCEQWNLKDGLGRNGRRSSIRRRDSGQDIAIVPGRAVIDGPVAMRSAFYNFEDFSLDSVAAEILGERKLITHKDSAAKIREIDRLFAEDKPALARYNLQDCRLVSDIFTETGLIELIVRRTEISGMLMEKLGRSVAAFDHFFLPRLHRKGYVALDVDDVEYHAQAPGGYVMEPRNGLYDHVIVLDFRSLYPSIIRTFRIDPYSLFMNAADPITVPGGQTFSRTEHILPGFIAELLDLRREAKQKQDDHLSMAIKILMNSFYGVMGSPGCRFYHPDLPTAITRTGQWLLLQSRAELEKRGFEVLYGDTDSLFIALRAADLPDPFQAGESLAASMNAFWSERIRNEYDSPSYLELEFEKYYRRFFLPPARGGGSAKKRYAGELMYPDGHTEIQFAGMEVVRSDWTALAKDFQRELYRLVFAGLPVDEWIKSFVQALKDGQYNEKLIYRKRLRKDVKEYVKNVPQHVRAAKMLDRPVREVRYLMTHDGPIPVQLNPANIDYEYYIEHQLKPIADTVLGALNTGFDEITKPTQLNLF